jgi:hypothetical protein
MVSFTLWSLYPSRQTTTITHWIAGYVVHRDRLDVSAGNAAVIQQIHRFKNTSVILYRIKIISCPVNQLGHSVPGGYKYRDLALQVGGVSNETVKYGCEFCGTSTQE